MLAQVGTWGLAIAGWLLASGHMSWGLLDLAVFVMLHVLHLPEVRAQNDRRDDLQRVDGLSTPR